MRKWASVLAIVACGVMTSSAQAQDAAGFEQYVQNLRARAIEQGISPATFDRLAPTLRFNSRVIELDRDQPGSSSSNNYPPFAPYRARHVDAARIDGGQLALQRLRRVTREIETRTGVPYQIALAIYGHETNYGRVTGGFDLPSALATLAYEGRRRDLFEGELIATMRMIEQGVPRERLEGSWAGAFGYPQFLPSVYLRLAADGDGDGIANIWSSEPDAIASIANYLVNAGWRRGEPWGIPVRVPASLNRGEQSNETRPTRCDRVHERHSKWRTLGEWRALGVRPAEGRWGQDDMMATLFEPDGQGSTGYLLTNNYRVILDYNCSNYYALSVGVLADEIGR